MSADVTAGTLSSSKLVVHHLNNSRSQRILWLLEELEVPYEIKKYERTPEMLAPEELKKVHPLGKAPIFTDGDVVVAESGAIVEYVISTFANGRLQAPESGKLDNLYFTHYAEGTLMPLLTNKLIYDIVPQRAPFIIRPIAKVLFSTVSQKLVDPRIIENRDFIEKHLVKSPTGWFAGGTEPTTADFMMIFALEALNLRAPGGATPRITEYLRRVHERPAYKRALEKGGKYDYV